jgi:hypothetical protein
MIFGGKQFFGGNTFEGLNRVARWFIFKPKIPIWVNFGKKLIYFMAIWNILLTFGIFYDHLVFFVFIWYIFSGLGVMNQEKSGNPGLKWLKILFRTFFCCSRDVHFIASQIKWCRSYCQLVSPSKTRVEQEFQAFPSYFISFHWQTQMRAKNDDGVFNL